MAERIRFSDLDKPYYVYILYRQDGVTPMYVGKGKNTRWSEHEYICKDRKQTKHNPRLYNYIRRLKALGIRVQKKKIYTDLTQQQAFYHEVELINKLGKISEGGILFNLINGGQGVTHTKETKKKISLTKKLNPFVLTPEQRLKMSLCKKGKPATEYQLKSLAIGWELNESRKGVPRTIEVKNKISIKLLGRHHSAESKSKISNSIKKINEFKKGLANG